MMFKRLFPIGTIALLSAGLLFPVNVYGQDSVRDQVELITEIHVMGTNRWQAGVNQVRPGDELRIRGRVTNISNMTVRDLQLVHVLPNSLELQSGEEMVEIDSINANDEKSFDVTVTINSNPVVNEQGCIETTTNLLSNSEIISTDLALICLGEGTFGDVLGEQDQIPTQNPETGYGGYELFAYGAIILGMANFIMGYALMRTRL